MLWISYEQVMHNSWDSYYLSAVVVNSLDLLDFYWCADRLAKTIQPEYLLIDMWQYQ